MCDKSTLFFSFPQALLETKGPGYSLHTMPSPRYNPGNWVMLLPGALAIF